MCSDSSAATVRRCRFPAIGSISAAPRASTSPSVLPTRRTRRALGSRWPARRSDHVAFAATRYEEIAARLAAADVVAVTNDVPDAEMRQIFLSDPNGVRIELNVT